MLNVLLPISDVLSHVLAKAPRFRATSLGPGVSISGGRRSVQASEGEIGYPVSTRGGGGGPQIFPDPIEIQAPKEGQFTAQAQAFLRAWARALIGSPVP